MRCSSIASAPRTGQAVIESEDRNRIHQSLRSRFFPIQNNRLHIVQAGDEDAPLVILLHGFPEFWYGWRNQIGAFAEAGYCVWAPDQRGYNLSGKPPAVADYKMDALVDDVIGLIDAAGRVRAILIGHDWGAAVAWWTAARHPDRVDALGILNVPHPAALRSALKEHWQQRLKSWYILFFQIPWLPELLMSVFGPPLIFSGSSQTDTFSTQDMQRYRQAWRKPGALRGMLAWYRAALRYADNTFTAGKVSVPTLILWGDRDVALDKRTADQSLAWCRQGRIIHFPSATHWIQHDEPEAVNSALLGFITEARGT
jgi:pimeloyl-ACP methyl ester carboxylesterase